MKPIIAPSILSADFADLRSAVELINQSQADWLHADIMDGMFVPNISFGFPVLKAIRQYSQKPLDVHLMIEQPERYIEQFHEHGAAVITVHIEACTHLHRTVQQIKNTGSQAGVAINPHTPVHFLEEIITEIDLVCVMSVNPGFGGQKFIPGTYSKIKKLKTLIEKTNSKALIEIDGGVGTQNASELIAAGADVLVAGNAVFGADNPKEVITLLKNSSPRSYA